MTRQQDMLSRCGFFPFGFSVRFNCARSSRVDYLSRPKGCDLTAEGLEPYHECARVVDASCFELIYELILNQFCTRNRLTVLPCFQIDFRAPLK